MFTINYPRSHAYSSKTDHHFRGIVSNKTQVRTTLYKSGTMLSIKHQRELTHTPTNLNLHNGKILEASRTNIGF